MQTTCEHCSTTFDHFDSGFGAQAGLAVCPSCGRDTRLDAGGAPAGGATQAAASEARVFCFNCGKSMPPREGELIPVCDGCRQDAGQPSAPSDSSEESRSLSVSSPDPVAAEGSGDWMIRKANGSVYGPFPTETIVEWIRARKINMDEEVAHIGGAWRLFGQHEDFASYFEQIGDVGVGSQRTQSLDFRRKAPIRDAARLLGRWGGTVAAFLAIGLGVWYLISNDILVLPESTISKVADKVSDSSRRNGDEKLVSDDATKLIEELERVHPEVLDPEADPGSSTELFLRGRTLARQDSVDDLAAARVELERAVVLDPSNALALAALAELYSLLAVRGEGSLDLQRQAIYLIEMADLQGTYSAEVLRARAAWLIYSGNLSEGVSVAQQALQKNPGDPELHFLLGAAAAASGEGISQAAQTHFDKALELDPGFHQVWYQLGVGAEESGQLRDAITHYEKKIELDPTAGAAHTRLGFIFEFVGDDRRASSHFDKAVALNPRDKEAVLHRAVLAYQVGGKPARAAELLSSLLAEGGPELRIRERKDIGVHLSAALRLAGDPEAALEALAPVLVEDAGYSPALFHQGLAELDLGRPSDAILSLGKADGNDLPDRERALVGFWAGRASFLAEQRSDALDAYTRAIEEDPEFVPAYLWRAELGLGSGDPQAAAQSLLDHLGRDPLAYARRREAGLYFQPLPPLDALSASFKSAAGREAFSPTIHAAAGVVLFHAGQYQAAAGFLQEALEQDERGEAARFYLGLIDYRRAQHRSAGAHFLALMQVRHNEGVYHAYLGDSLLEQGRIEEAIASYEKAVGYGDATSWTHTRMAEALARGGDRERASDQLGRATQLDETALAPRQQRYRLNL